VEFGKIVRGKIHEETLAKPCFNVTMSTIIVIDIAVGPSVAM